MDEKGIIPEALDEMMTQWNEAERGGPRPKMLVVVPYVLTLPVLQLLMTTTLVKLPAELVIRTCSNPSGITIPLERKREIYAMCRKWELLICEDDPCLFPHTSLPHPLLFYCI